MSLKKKVLGGAAVVGMTVGLSFAGAGAAAAAVVPEARTTRAAATRRRLRAGEGVDDEWHWCDTSLPIPG